jgi:hypothetical protein
MNRRCAIRQLVTLTGGVLVLHSCIEDRSTASLSLKNYTLTGDQENLLAMLAETFIPKTSTPGGRDIYAHHFAMKMVDDCMSTADRERFLRGLEAFAENARSMNGTSFHQTAIYGREKVVRALQERKEEKDSDETFFYKRMKNLTIRAYTSSKFYLTDVQPYELVPSRWSGCVAVS